MKWSKIVLWCSLLVVDQIYADSHIHIIQSSSLPRADKLVEELKSILGSSLVTTYNMESRDDATRIIEDRITNSGSVGSNDWIVAIGYPATKLAFESLRRYRIAYTMVNSGRIKPKAEIAQNAFFISDKLTVSEQLSLIGTIVPAIQVVGLISSDTIQKNAAKCGTSHYGFRVECEFVTSSKDVPAALRRFNELVDALIFVQDPVVVNRDSLEFLVTKTFAEKIPTFVYSEYLVKAGFLASSVKRLQSVAEEIGALIGAQSGGGNRNSQKTVDPYYFFINRRTFKRLELPIISDKKVEQRWFE